MIEHTLRHTIPAAYALLPPEMASPPATAMLLATELQESKGLERRQLTNVGFGPARGLWQFERAGVAGVMKHPATANLATSVLEQLRYGRLAGDAFACQLVIEHNDTLACAFARLLLFTLPAPLPSRWAAAVAWQQYLEAWRPGAPRPDDWPPNYLQAWALVRETGVV